MDQVYSWTSGEKDIRKTRKIFLNYRLSCESVSVSVHRQFVIFYGLLPFTSCFPLHLVVHMPYNGASSLQQMHAHARTHARSSQNINKRVLK